MSRKDFKGFGKQSQPASRTAEVDSLLDVMQDGNEFGSLIDKRPKDPNLREEIRRAIAEIEAIRKRPLLLYVANVVKPLDAPTGIILSDDLPFAEMVAQVGVEHKSVDLVVVTPGGLANQVAKFVNCLRPRFDDVAFFLPHMAMSAGTIWVMSGDELWMDERAVIGPIDPQAPGRDGRFLPLQALMVLVDEIRVRGELRLKAGEQPSWSDIAILRNLDAKELGDAYSASQYSIQLTTDYLAAYKLQHWKTRGDGSAVTDEIRKARARWIAEKLCNHSDWRAHSHGITRDVAHAQLKLEIKHPESVEGLNRAIRRLWALLYWTFDNSLVAKLFLSQRYSLFRTATAPAGGPR